MKTRYYVLLAVLVISACKKINPGYLETGTAQYNPDSLVVRKELQDTMMYGEDYDRNRLNLPWVSTPLEGIIGTAQIKVALKSVTSKNGNAEMMKSAVFVRGDGTISVPLRNTIPVGVYLVSLQISNEGHTDDLDNIFKIIVVQK